MMGKYEYFILGILLGIGIVIYLWASREEKIEQKIKEQQKIFSTEKLDITMEMVVEKINNNVKRLKRNLTEEEKNEIIVECYKKTFTL